MVSQGHGHVHRQTINTSTTTEHVNITDSAKRNSPPGQDPATSHIFFIRMKAEYLSQTLYAQFSQVLQLEDLIER